MTRVGVGYDIHPLVVGRKLVLGGVTVPFERGLAGHSDADVLVHSVIDALLGAAALGDIGTHFPSTDERYRGISSLVLLSRAVELVSEKNYRVVNIDATVVAERPRLTAYVNEMRLNICQAAGISVEQVSVKATTAKGLGPIGQVEGIAALAVVLIEEGV